MQELLLALAFLATPPATVISKDAAAQYMVNAHDFKGALAAYTELTRSQPDSPANWIWKARLEAWTKAYPQAEASYAEIERRWPTNVEALVGHTYLEIWSAKFRQAELLLEHAEQLAPNNVGVLAVRVRLLRLWGKKQPATLALAHLERQYPNHPETEEVRHEFETAEGNWKASSGTTIDQLVPGEIGFSEFARLRYTAGRNTAEMALTETQRQSQHQTQLPVSYLRRAGENYWLAAHGTFAIGAVSTASSEVGAGAARKLFAGTAAGVSFSHVQFHNASVDSLSSSFEPPLGKHSATTFTYSRAWIEKAGFTQQSESYSASYGATIGSRFSLTAATTASNLLVNQATEAELGVGKDKSIALAARLRISRSLALSADWIRRIAGTHPRWLGMGIALSRSW